MRNSFSGCASDYEIWDAENHTKGTARYFLVMRAPDAQTAYLTGKRVRLSWTR
jgi:hypothetical protein